jgi:hypothetical protein
MAYQKTTPGRSRSDEDAARAADREAVEEMVVLWGFSRADAVTELKRREAARRS